MSILATRNLDRGSLREAFFTAKERKDIAVMETTADLMKRCFGYGPEDVRHACKAAGIDVFDQDVTENRFVPDCVVRNSALGLSEAA